MNRHRRSIRLCDYDYTQSGAYFVTICTYERRCLFGQIIDGNMVSNEWGAIVQEEWEQTAILRPNVELDTFVVMPNHIHGVIVITDDGRGTMHCAPTYRREFSKPVANSLSTIIGTFKAAVTRRINRLPDMPDHPIWQRNYYEHVIRDERSLNRIRAYVVNNPATWAKDSLFLKT